MEVEQAIRRAIIDDCEASWEVVYREYYSGLLAYAREKCNYVDSYDPETLVATAFARLWLRRKHLDADIFLYNRLIMYLRRSVANLVIDKARRVKVRREVPISSYLGMRLADFESEGTHEGSALFLMGEELQDDDPETLFLDHEARVQRSKVVHTTLEAIAGNTNRGLMQRQLLEDLYFDEMTYKQLADKHRVSWAAIKSQVFRARATFVRTATGLAEGAEA